MKIFTNVSDGSVIPHGQPFVINDVAYPFNWLDLASDEDLQAHGITVQDLPDPEPPTETPPGPPGPPTLIAVTPRQARLALLEAGLLPQINMMIRGADEATQITWDYATIISREDPLIASIGSALSLTDAQIDALFDRASTL